MIAIGTVLYTKDGRKSGNGIVLDSAYAMFTDETYYVIRTDFGNIITLSEEQVERDYYLANYKISPVTQLRQQTEALTKLAEKMKLWR